MKRKKHSFTLGLVISGDFVNLKMEDVRSKI